ncbi:uncharacterized protein [Palaemon carinicauda]|uniref:uncharacterized protein n=1 Tax=Palaemon carinicauda TaxID=392227 RepID=UPI0035B5FAD5
MESIWVFVLAVLVQAAPGSATYGSRPLNVCEGKTIIKKIVAPRYVTKTQLVPQYSTVYSTLYQTQYQTQVQAQYVTLTDTKPVYYTKTVVSYVTKTEYANQYVTQTVQSYLTKTVKQQVYVTRPCNGDVNADENMFGPFLNS